MPSIRCRPLPELVTVHAETRRPIALVTADILRGADGAEGERGKPRGRFIGRQRVDGLARQHALFTHVLDVHPRRRAGDRDRFLDPTDCHVSVRRRDKPHGQRDLFADERAESRQREGDAVDTWYEPRDPEQPLAVGDGHPGSFNHRRAIRFHRDTREHSARCVPDDPGNPGGLRRGRPGHQEECKNHGCQQIPSMHGDFSFQKTNLLRWDL